MINHVPMRLKNRQVSDPVLIEAILKMIQICHMGMNDSDGYPYVVPINYGFERTDETFIFYLHFSLQGHLVDCLKADNRVCLTFSAYDDFPDAPYKGHKHDYRSVIAKGRLEMYDLNDDASFDLFMCAHELLMTTNGREFDYEKRSKQRPPMYMARVVCPYADVTAKSEFPLETVDDVPFHKR